MKRHDPYTQEYKLEAILDPDSSTFLIPRCTFLTIKRTLRAWSLTGGNACGHGRSRAWALKGLGANGRDRIAR